VVQLNPTISNSQGKYFKFNGSLKQLSVTTEGQIQGFKFGITGNLKWLSSSRIQLYYFFKRKDPCWSVAGHTCTTWCLRMLISLYTCTNRHLESICSCSKTTKSKVQYSLVLHQSSLTSSFKLLTRTTGVPSPIPPLAPVAARKSGKKWFDFKGNLGWKAV